MSYQVIKNVKSDCCNAEVRKDDLGVSAKYCAKCQQFCKTKSESKN